MFCKWAMILLAVIWKSPEIGSDFFLEVATHEKAFGRFENLLAIAGCAKVKILRRQEMPLPAPRSPPCGPLYCLERFVYIRLRRFPACNCESKSCLKEGTQWGLSSSPGWHLAPTVCQVLMPPLRWAAYLPEELGLPIQPKAPSQQGRWRGFDCLTSIPALIRLGQIPEKGCPQLRLKGQTTSVL